MTSAAFLLLLSAEVACSSVGLGRLVQLQIVLGGGVSLEQCLVLRFDQGRFLHFLGLR